MFVDKELQEAWHTIDEKAASSPHCAHKHSPFNNRNPWDAIM